MKILLVEDEKRLSDALKFILKKNSYSVECAYDGDDGEYMALNGSYDLIILDRMLPHKEGTQILKEIRRVGISTPVIFLTALDSVSNKVEGLDAGADDYLVKPFSTEELLARIRAISRRPIESFIENKLPFSDIILDVDRKELWKNDTLIKLSMKETQLLEFFIRNKGQVLSKEKILERIWGFNSEVELNNIEIYIHHLRKKFDSIDSSILIETIRSIGYCLKER